MNTRTSIDDRIITEGRVPEWTLADRLAKARISAGLSQADVAELLDCSVGSVGRWENGFPVKRSAVLHYALVTGVSFEWLLKGDLRSRCFQRPGRPMWLAVAA